jgi:hypothetical protein
MHSGGVRSTNVQHEIAFFETERKSFSEIPCPNTQSHALFEESAKNETIRMIEVNDLGKDRSLR